MFTVKMQASITAVSKAHIPDIRVERSISMVTNPTLKTADSAMSALMITVEESDYTKAQIPTSAIVTSQIQMHSAVRLWLQGVII